jgi:hypothetical protein
MDAEQGRGTRDNGLRCGAYKAVADLDPRIADALLEALRDNGIAAYAGPTPATSGHYMELQLPDRPIDRLYVDEEQLDRARALVEEEQAEAAAMIEPPPTEPTATEPAPADAMPVDAMPVDAMPVERGSGDDSQIDFDAAWKQLLGSLQETSTTSVRFPAASRVEEPAAPTDVVDTDEDGDDVDYDVYDPADEAHFEPPPPPPLPKLRKETLAALVAIGLGLFALATDFEDGAFTFLAIMAIIGGVVSLVWHMKQGPPTDSGWDDGAVV